MDELVPVSVAIRALRIIRDMAHLAIEGMPDEYRDGIDEEYERALELIEQEKL